MADGKRDPVDGEVERLLISGQKIAAIRLVRERTGADLKAAKEHVEAVASRLPPGTLPPRKVISGPGCLAAVVVIVILWWFLRVML